MSRSRSRSPLKNDKESEMSKKEDHVGFIDSYVVKMENVICSHWTVQNVKNFLKELPTSDTVFNNIKRIIMGKYENGIGCCLIRFPNSYFSHLALHEWSALSTDKKITVSLDTAGLISKQYKLMRMEMKRLKKQNHELTRKFTKNNSKQDNKKTYGLSLQYLESLSIKLPLQTQVFVGNLDTKVDEAKIREIFSFAGHIVHILIVRKDDHKQKVFAKVEYDHPLEAVQAISMFHGQELYSRRLIVQMDERQEEHIPEGLGGFGPGLGLNGEPLRGIRTMVEIRAVKQLLMQEASKMKDSVQNKNIPMNPFQPEVVTNMNSAIVQNKNIPMNPFQPEVVTNMNSAMPVVQPAPVIAPTAMMPWNFMTAPAMTNLMMPTNQQDTSDLQQAVNSLLQNTIAQNMAQNAPTPQWQSAAPVNLINNSPQPNATRMDVGPNEYGNRNDDDRRTNKDTGKSDDRGPKQGSSRGKDHDNPDNSDMLLFKNLPSSVSLKALTNKMKEVGDLKFAEMTGRGRAIVRFFSSRDAGRCIKLFDKSRVDGQTIDVRFI